MSLFVSPLTGKPVNLRGWPLVSLEEARRNFARIVEGGPGGSCSPERATQNVQALDEEIATRRSFDESV